MPRVRLSDSRDWELTESDKDLRGRDLWDAHGHRLGEIQDMVVDTDAQRVDTVVLDNGDEYRTQDLSIGEDAVYVLNYDAAQQAAPGPVRRYEDDRLRRREAAPADPPPVPASNSTAGADAPRQDASRGEARAGTTYADHADAFRQHYDSAYRDAGLDFTDWDPAYRYGYDAAFDTDHAGRDYDSVEDTLRRGYYQRHGYPMSDRIVWHQVRGAVRHAFERARGL
jgi:sporulation protein YlmC with PRC-barrel domain